MNSTMGQAFALAVRSYHAGRHSDAEQLYRAILEVYPNHADAHHNLGLLKIDAGRPHDAIGFLQAALNADQGRGVFWISYIEALIELGRIAEASTLLVEARSLGLDGSAVVQLERRLSAAAANLTTAEPQPSPQELDDVLASYSVANYSVAEQQAIALTQHYPNHSFGWKSLGVILQGTGRVKESLGPLLTALTINPEDTETHCSLGNALKEHGRLTEAEERYRDAIRLEPEFAEAHSNLGNLLNDTGRSTDAEVSCREAIRLAPDFPEAANNLGNALKKMGQLLESEASYRDAIRLRPAYAEAHSNLGLVLKELGRVDEAESSYREAIRLKADYAKAYSNLGLLLNDTGRVAEAESILRDAIRVNPACAEAHINLGNVHDAMGRFAEAEADYREATLLTPESAEAHSNLGVILKKRGRQGEAEASFLKAISLRPGYSHAYWNLSLERLLHGDFEEGWKHYEHRWSAVDKMKKSQRHFPQPLWLGRESLTGKTILIHAEQGLGDTLQFCRYLQMVKSLGATVIFEVFSSLIGILADVDGVDQLVARCHSLPRFDYHCPLLSLPLAFNTKLETIPAPIRYLTAQPERVARWKDRLGLNGLKVGVCWRSSDLIKERSIPLECLAGLSKIRGVRLISLHKGDGEKELATLPADLHVESLGSEFDSDGAFLDTAAVIECCDLVITTDTSVAHLAGALGARTWVMLPFVPDWRWMMEREDSPWYPTARLFRQRAAGEWQVVLEQMICLLKTELAKVSCRDDEGLA